MLGFNNVQSFTVTYACFVKKLHENLNAEKVKTTFCCTYYSITYHRQNLQNVESQIEKYEIVCIMGNAQTAK